MLAIYLLLAAATIRGDRTPLRTSCDSGAEVMTTLAAGQTAEVKFAMSGAAPCYKIAVTVDGHSLAGYVRPSDLENTEQFDRDRRSGAEVGRATGEAVDTNGLADRSVKVAAANPELRSAIDALTANQPGRALALLEPAARNTRNPDLLSITGIAAWRNDEPRAALDYWKRSMELRPDAELGRLYAKVERESAADRSSGRIVGLRILLRYEPDVVSADVARTMALALDTELGRISSELGCSPEERLVAIVQTRDAYLRSSGAAEWSGGVYDGRIRIALIEDGTVGPGTRRAFAHELVHACLATIGRFPSWLHEGLAQKLSGDQLGPALRKEIQDSIAAGRLAPLEKLDPRGADTARARLVYGVALAAADLLLARHLDMGIRNILASESLLTQVTFELNRELGLTRSP